jgi:YHS domain-containing protein
MKKIIPALAAACFSSALLAQSSPQSPQVSLKGHDPVSYFTDGRPVKGSASINYDFDEARYLFSSQKNRERFASSPERYTPQFAGLCATGLAYGMKAEADPTIWRIVDGKLYVFSNAGAREKFDQDPSMLAKSQQNWQPRR